MSARSEHPRSGARVVFWDFDGTLAQREGLFAGALQDALDIVAPAHGVALEAFRPGLRSQFPWHSPDIIAPPVSGPQWWARLHPVFVDAYVAAGVARGVAADAADLVGDEFYRTDAWTLVDGACEALSAVRDAGYENVILSNHGPGLPLLVEQLGLRSLVTRTITSAAVGIEKPNPAIFAHALEISNAGTDVWMVGDNPIADVQGAEQVGIRAILADGVYPDSRGVTVREAARLIVERRHA